MRKYLRYSRYLLFAAALVAGCGPAWSQDLGLIAPGHVIGNGGTANPGEATDYSLSSVMDQALGLTRGMIVERGVSGWTGVAPGAAGLPWVSNGAGADPNYQAIGLSALPCTGAGAFAVGTGAAVQCSSTAGSVATLNGGPLTINPTSGTINQGFVITHTMPSSGTSVGPINANNITGSYRGTTNCVGSVWFQTNGATCSDTSLLRVTLSVGGPNYMPAPGITSAPALAVFGHIIHDQNSTGAFQDSVGVGALAFGSATNSGGGGLYAMNAVSQADAGGSYDHVAGIEVDVPLVNGGIARSYRSGVTILNSGTGTSALLDTAFMVVSGNSGGNFKRMLTLSSLGGTNNLTTTGAMFMADIAMTVADIFSFVGSCAGTAPAQGPCNVTVTGNILGFPNVTIAGSGISTFGGATNSTGQVSLSPSPNAATGATLVSMTNAAGMTVPGTGTLLALLANEAGRTTVRYGLTLGNYAEITAFNSGALGFIIGTNTNIPLLFGTNNVLAGSVRGGSSPQWYLGNANVALPSGPVLIASLNAGAIPSSIPSNFAGTVQLLANADGVSSRLVIVGAGAAPSAGRITLLSSRNTVASPTASQLNDTLGSVFAGGFGATVWGLGAGIVVTATQNWTDANQGASLSIQGTPNGSTTPATVATYQVGVQVGSPTGGDKGAGTINVAGDVYKNGTIIGETATTPITLSAGGAIGCATCVTSAASLTANQLVIGSGSQGEQSLGTLGTTTTVLHGNAGGAPTFAAVVSADLNITTTTCTNQFVTAISTGAVGTCTTDTLASAQHANQGTTTTVLHGNAAGNPSWAAVSLTADVSGILPVANGGTNCAVASITCFNNITGFSAAGATGTTSTNLVFSTSPTITTPNITTSATLSNNNIGAVSTDGFVLQNTQAAAVGAQQYSPRVHWIGSGWKTDATAGAQTIDWIAEIRPIQGTAAPNANLVFSTQVAGGGYTTIITFGLNGGGNSQLYFNSPSNKATNLVYQNNAAAVWYAGNAGASSDTYTILNSDANGNATRLFLNQGGELGLSKITASGTSPGAGFMKFAVTAGTNVGTCKLIAYAGTSTTPVTIIDNVGAGC